MGAAAAYGSRIGDHHDRARALRDGHGWPRDETLSAGTLRNCVLYILHASTRKSLAPLAARPVADPRFGGYGHLRAHSHTRLLYRAATSHGVQDGVLPRRTAAARVATHQLTRSPRRVTRIAGRTVDSTAGSSPTKRRSNKLIWCSSLLPAAALLIVERIARGRHRWASAMAQLAPCDCTLMRTPAE